MLVKQKTKRRYPSHEAKASGISAQLFKGEFENEAFRSFSLQGSTPPMDRSAPVRECNQKITSAVKNKRGETHVDSGVKILIAVVVGAILMTGLVALFNKTILPSAANKVGSLFDQANVENQPWSSELGGSSMGGVGGVGGPGSSTSTGSFPITWNALAVKDNATIAVTSPDGSVTGERLTAMGNYFCKVSGFAPTEAQLTRTEMKISASRGSWYPAFVNSQTVPGAVLVKYTDGTDTVWGLSVDAPGTYDLSAAYTLVYGSNGSVTGEVTGAGFYCLNYAKNSGNAAEQRSYTIDLEEGNMVVDGLVDGMVVYDASTSTYYTNAVETLTTFGIGTSVTYSLNGLPAGYAPADNDLVYYGDYKYTYNSTKSWVPRVRNIEKTRYAPIAKTLLGKDITTLERTYYECYGLEIMPQIPNSVTTIGDRAFHYCQQLASIAIPNSVIAIGTFAFSNCDNLASITIPDSVTSIGGYAFLSCSSLANVVIPDSVTTIGYDAFSNCQNLSSVTIPDSVTSIGENAFMLCADLTSITIPDSVTSIGQNAFGWGTNLANVTFTNTEGWYVTETKDATSGIDIDPEDLANPSAAATLITSTYANYYWYRRA